jgi:sulfite reductase (ferredoxin)
MTAEDVKVGSRYLRGTLADELAEPSAAFSVDNTQLLKFHGVYQQDDRDQRRALAQKKLPLAYVCMVRTSVPGGVLSAEQYLTMDALTDKVSNGTLRVTTRQGIQFHFVAKGDLVGLISTLNEHLVTTKGACGDVVRNVVAGPAPVLGRPGEPRTVAAAQIAARFRPQTRAYYELWVEGEKAVSALEPREGSVSAPGGAAAPGSRPAGGGSGAGGASPADDEPIYGAAYLPRKFKIGFAWPGDNCIDVYSQDVGLVAHEGGFVILAGGGLGLAHAREDDTYARLGTPFFWVPAERLGETVEAIVTTQRDYGNREDRHRARLKYTIDDRGLDWFRAEVAERVGRPLEPAPPLPPWHDSDEHLGWFPQPDGRWCYGVHVDSGRIADGDAWRARSALRELVERYEPEVRLTTRQDVLLANLEEGDRAGIEAVLRAYGMAPPAEQRPVRRLAMSCPALPTCGQALAEAERAMPDLIGSLEGALDEHDLGDLPLRVNVTGCPNGCARPYTAEVGIVGRTKTGYDLYVGGSVGGDRLAERVAVDVPIGRMAEAVAPLLARYRAEAGPGEAFGDFCHRIGPSELAVSIPTLSRRRGGS